MHVYRFASPDSCARLPIYKPWLLCTVHHFTRIRFTSTDSCAPLPIHKESDYVGHFSMESIKQAKGNECSQSKSTPAIVSSSLPSCPVYFHLVMPRHVLSSCYARHEHTRGIKEYVTYYLACYVRLEVQNMPYYMRLPVQDMPGCHLRKYGWGKSADWRKNSEQYFCTNCIHFLRPV